MTRRSFLSSIVAATVAYPHSAYGESSYPPSLYVRSPEYSNFGVLAASRIRPIDNRITMVGIGMSNARLYFKPISGLLNKSKTRHPAFRFINVARGGHTATEWSDYLNLAWVEAVRQVSMDSGNPLQVQAAHIFMTQAYPAINGQMTAGQLSSIVLNAKSYFPNLCIVYLSSIGYTGYAAPPESNRAPVWSVHADSLLMAEMVTADTAWPPGVWVEFLDVFADGRTPNPLTHSSPSWPSGIWYQPLDFQEDMVHPSQIGAQSLARNVVERFSVDPVTYGWMRR